MEVSGFTSISLPFAPAPSPEPWPAGQERSRSAGQVEILQSPDALGKHCEITQPPPDDSQTEKSIAIAISEAKSIRWKLLEVAADLLPGHRVRDCQSRRIDADVGIRRGESGAYFVGVVTCGSVWACPVCASKISERRRLEIKEAIDRWRANGGTICFLTLTTRHYSFDPLPALLKGFGQARRLFRNRKPWKRFARIAGLAHSLYALEVTYGANGWHVHSHELLFLEPGQAGQAPAIAPEEWNRVLIPAWIDACVTAGLRAPDGHGAMYQDGEAAEKHLKKYMSKWGLDLELTKSHIKKGNGGNLTPWDMLRIFSETGDFAFADRYREFVSSFAGKKQLIWSRGFREAVGLEPEKSDQELAEEPGETTVLLGRLSSWQWKQVLRRGLRYRVLELAMEGFSLVEDLIGSEGG